MDVASTAGGLLSGSEASELFGEYIDEDSQTVHHVRILSLSVTIMIIHLTHVLLFSQLLTGVVRHANLPAIECLCSPAAHMPTSPPPAILPACFCVASLLAVLLLRQPYTSYPSLALPS